MVPHFNIGSVILDIRSPEITFCTFIDSQLAVVIKLIAQRRAALLAESSLTDLMDSAVVRHLLIDPVGDVRISRIHGKEGAQGVIPVHDDLHVRGALHHFL